MSLHPEEMTILCMQWIRELQNILSKTHRIERGQIYIQDYSFHSPLFVSIGQQLDRKPGHYRRLEQHCQSLWPTWHL